MLLIHTTDRCSAFDRYICDIPCKGVINNNVSAWWFEKTKHIVKNHMICNLSNDGYSAMIVKRFNVFPVEFVVRAYITGSTDTAMWTLYNKGVRNFNGFIAANDLRKNEKLPNAIVTPTTKSNVHDEPIGETLKFFFIKKKINNFRYRFSKYS